MRPDENVELFTLHLHVVLLLVQLVLQSGVDLHQFITAQLLRLCLMDDKTVNGCFFSFSYLMSIKCCPFYL